MSNPFKVKKSKTMPYAYDIFLNDNKVCCVVQEIIDDMFDPKVDFYKQTEIILGNTLAKYTETDVEKLREVLKPHAYIN